MPWAGIFAPSGQQTRDRSTSVFPRSSRAESKAALANCTTDDQRLLVTNDDSPPLHLDPPFSDQLEGFWECFAFGLKDTVGESIRRIFIQDGHGLLQDYGTVIIDVVREMDRAAAHFGSVVDDGLVHASPIVALTTERRNEGRVNIDDTIMKILGDRHEPYESRHDDELDARIAAGLKDPLLELLILAGRIGSHDERGDVGIDGDFEACCIGPARDHQSYLNIELCGRAPL